METITTTDKATQRQFILARLRERPHSTLEFRAMGICSPAPRIKELRAHGFEISTGTRTETDSAGVLHNGIAVYALLGEPEHAESANFI